MDFVVLSRILVMFFGNAFSSSSPSCRSRLYPLLSLSNLCSIQKIPRKNTNSVSLKWVVKVDHYVEQNVYFAAACWL